MLIQDIVPYGRNARRNERAVPAVAESIREFGFRGQIVLESRENPVIVCGHTRVEACKSLGWEEIPDEHIAFCDGLTADEVKALRLADNKTGEIATWNIGMLKSEMASIAGKLDMGRYGFRFDASKAKGGAERLRTDGAYNLDLVSRADCGRDGMPRLRRCMARPADLVGFNYAKGMAEADKAGKACHFFIDNYQFERCWNGPRRCLDWLRGFDCVLTPDFSLYMDMPDPVQRWNVYRSRALGRFWQSEGLRVVPTLSWAQPESLEFCFAGLPKRGTVAVSTVGCMADPEALDTWKAGMRRALTRLEPGRVLLYGSRPEGYDFGPAEVVEYKNHVTERMAGHGGDS